ncbi:microsomal triglyceride transfer protein large subunit-like [Mercenaria mercenaria]|uniref:microsomal triglyceride transfer protein large subunit-like n=1 Tax=Mercenaria mercenaria TaxID=6596 RepID=UPI00234F5FEB|nr:microsomal triglyceride transfer protein large subunit-like [Mercenaria mercenaria]
MAAEYSYIVYIYFLFAILALQGECVHYELGKTYKYTYETKVLFNDDSPKKETRAYQDVGLRVRLEFDFTPMFEDKESQMVRLQVSQAALTSLHRGGMEGQLLDMVKFPVYFEYMDGTVGRVYVIENDSIFCTNIKKGLISMFQVQSEPGERSELDVSGECKTVYEISGPTIVKQKFECENLEIAGQHKNENEVFGVSSSSSRTWTYQLENNVVHSMMGSNRHVASINIKSTLNAMVLAVQKLTLLSTEPAADTDKLPVEDFESAAQFIKDGSNYPVVETLLPSAPEIQHCTRNTCQKPQDVITKVKDSLVSEKVGTAESGKAFLELLKAFRTSGKEKISEAMTGPDSTYTVPQLLDIGAATQTPSAQKAMMELLNFEETKNLAYPLRYLLGAAYTTHPGEYLVKDLLKLFKQQLPSPDVREAVALALGAVVYNFCQDPEQCQFEIIKDYKKSILDFFTQCPEEKCHLLYVRSMGNSGLPDFKEKIFETISNKDSSSMLGFTAVQALRRISSQYIEEKDIKSLLKIYHQTERTYDTSVRAASVELLLSLRPSTSIVRNLMLAAQGDQINFELSTFILRKIVDIAKYSPELRNTTREILKDTAINNYNIWAQKGKSSAFSSLLAETQDANATYGLYMEMARSKVLKKSAMDINIVNNDAVQKILSFGIYASGLESLLGEEPDPDAGDEEATAGLGLKILDVALPSVEFFRGSGGLMSAVWNAPSDPVTALQMSFLLQDHSERFHLANGLVVDLQVLGVASIDLTGMVSISLWNRNSESLIRNSGALVIEGGMRLASEMGRAGVVFTAEGEAFIDFETDVDFYQSPFKMCMQMKRPKAAFKHTVDKYEKATRFDRSFKSKVSKLTYIEGLSYFLSQKNSEECKALLSNK